MLFFGHQAHIRWKVTAQRRRVKVAENPSPRGLRNRPGGRTLRWTPRPPRQPSQNAAAELAQNNQRWRGALTTRGSSRRSPNPDRHLLRVSRQARQFQRTTGQPRGPNGRLRSQRPKVANWRKGIKCQWTSPSWKLKKEPTPHLHRLKSKQVWHPQTQCPSWGSIKQLSNQIRGLPDRQKIIDLSGGQINVLSSGNHFSLSFLSETPSS